MANKSTITKNNQWHPPQIKGANFTKLLATWWGRVTSFIVSLAILLVAWNFASGHLISEILLPKPLDVANAILWLPHANKFTIFLTTTLQEVLIGFALGAGSGLLLGLLCSLSPLIKKSLQPYIVYFQNIPKIAFVPLFFVWFGMGAESKIVLATVQGFFPVFVNTILGLTLVPEAAARLMYSLGSSRIQRFRILQFPNALPFIFAGIQTALMVCFVSVIVAEFLGGNIGLGGYIVVFTDMMRVDRAFAVIFLISVMALIIFYGVDCIGRKLVFWEKKGEGRMPTM
ncbi:ABC transporter permease [Chloroflexota bacterium]